MNRAFLTGQHFGEVRCEVFALKFYAEHSLSDLAQSSSASLILSPLRWEVGTWICPSLVIAKFSFMDASGRQLSFRHSGEGSRKIPEPGAVGLSLAFQRTTADSTYCLSVLMFWMFWCYWASVMPWWWVLSQFQHLNGNWGQSSSLLLGWKTFIPCL